MPAMAMDMEDIMQDNSDRKENREEREIDLFQLLIDTMDDIREYGWLILALTSIVGTLCFFAARFRYTPYKVHHQ